MSTEISEMTFSARNMSNCLDLTSRHLKDSFMYYSSTLCGSVMHCKQGFGTSNSSLPFFSMVLWETVVTDIGGVCFSLSYRN